MKPIAIAFSDLHINDWSKFNANGERTLNHFRVFSIIRHICNKYKCPALFCGDLFHKPENMSLDLFTLTINEFKKLDEGWDMYAISGNHDMIYSNSPENPQESWMSSFGKLFDFIKNLDFNTATLEEPSIKIWGIPYLDHNKGLNEYIKKLIGGNSLDPHYKHILMLHSDYPGAKDTDGTEVGSCENLNTNLLQKFNLVLMGHIHKPQRLMKKVIMVGAPLQQRRSDKDCDFGYWKIYPDCTAKFRRLDIFPKFIDVDSEDKIKDDGNYYTVVSKPQETKLEELPTISRDLSKKKIVRSYLKARGIEDPQKKKLLTKLIKEAEE